MPTKRTQRADAAPLPPRDFWPALVTGAHAIEYLSLGKTWQGVAEEQRLGLSAQQTHALADFAVGCFPTMRPYSPDYAAFKPKFDEHFGDTSRFEKLPGVFLGRTLVLVNDSLIFTMCACLVPMGHDMEAATFSPIYICKPNHGEQPTEKCSVVTSLLDALVHFSVFLGNPPSLT
jgi:hypothetical protein